jgi:DNA-binding CsgD family transcriptional regulator
MGTESETAERLHAAFATLGNPMLLVDDERRCVAAHSAACGLLGIEPQEVPWRRIDDFTPAEDRKRLDEQWAEFLASGAIEGWYYMPLPTGRVLPIEFSATANVLPGRHLSVVMPWPGRAPAGEARTEVRVERGRMAMVRRQAGWTHIVAPDVNQLPLTEREREVLTLVAGGLTGGDIALQLILSPETIKSHVQNAMAKLGAHTRAHAVAIALRTGQIDILTARREQAEAESLELPDSDYPRRGARSDSHVRGMARSGEGPHSGPEAEAAGPGPRPVMTRFSPTEIPA